MAQPGGPFGAETGIRLGGVVGFFLARGFHACSGCGAAAYS